MRRGKGDGIVKVRVRSRRCEVGGERKWDCAASCIKHRDEDRPTHAATITTTPYVVSLPVPLLAAAGYGDISGYPGGVRSAR